MMPDYKLFINGEFVETQNKQKIIDPSTGEYIAQVSVASELEVENAILAAREAFDNGSWSKLDLDSRNDFLLQISQGILDVAQELGRVETLNTGKPIKESTFMDVPSSAKTFEHFAQKLEEYLKEDPIESIENTKSILVREPVGVVVLIVPWNYPLLIACWKLAAALAAGNTVILKPSSLTPLSVMELAKVIQKINLPKGVVNIINGSGEKLGNLLCSDKRVDMVSFTGSGDVGKNILQYTSSNIKKSIMELGGKSASIIYNDIDLDVVVNSSLCSIFLNQGQMCTAMSRIFVQENVYEKFVSEFVKKAKQIKIGPGSDFETQMGPLVSESQLRKVLEFVVQAKEDGATILCGGRRVSGGDFDKGFYFEPTVITDVVPAMSIFKEEVFGPVVCIMKFKNQDEVIKLANNSDFGLASCVWSQDEAKAQSTAQSLNAGTVWVNTYGMFYNELPYGGFKQSGFGKDLGKQGFLEYTRLKNIIIDQSAEGKPLVNYWYGF